MSKDDIVRAVLVDGRVYQPQADGSLVSLKGETDWARIDAMTDEQLTAIAESDEDSKPITDEEWARAEIVFPEKVPVGIKLDADVLDWFKLQGRGYQKRINAVLRRYYEAHRKAG